MAIWRNFGRRKWMFHKKLILKMCCCSYDQCCHAPITKTPWNKFEEHMTPTSWAINISKEEKLAVIAPILFGDIRSSLLCMLLINAIFFVLSNTYRPRHNETSSSWFFSRRTKLPFGMLLLWLNFFYWLIGGAGYVHLIVFPAEVTPYSKLNTRARSSGGALLVFWYFMWPLKVTFIKIFTCTSTIIMK